MKNEKRFIDPITGVEYMVIGNSVLETMSFKNIIISLVPFCFVNSLHRRLINGVWPKYISILSIDSIDEKEKMVVYIQPELNNKIKVPYTVA